jgi:Icc protein
MKIIWLTDIHLNFVQQVQVSLLCDRVNALNPQIVLIGGDIAEAPSICDYLEELLHQLHCPVYFVLGNHDFYQGSIDGVRREVGALAEQMPDLHYLTQSGVVKLTDNCCLVGHDGWSDGRNGDYEGSNVMLNDYVSIDELAGLSKVERLAKLNALGDEAAQYLRQTLTTALVDFNQVLMLLHVPPFLQASWHEGNWSDDEYAPHFTCKAAGDMLLEVMSKHPQKSLSVFCGHTHSGGLCLPLPNVSVRTGGAEYDQPRMQEPIYIPD